MSAAQSRQLRATQEASSGLRVNAPSDDPTAAAASVRVQASSDRTKDFRSTISTVSGDAHLAETTLEQATDLLQQAHDLAIQGANGSTTTTERDALSTQVQSLRERLIALANQKGSQGYLFGGTLTDTAPFSSTGAYQGNDEQRVIEVAAGVTTVVNTDGQSSFADPSGRNIFDDLQSLADSLDNDDQAGAEQSVSDLGDGVNQLVEARIEAGIRASRLDSADSVHAQTQTSLATEQKNLVATDQASSYTELARAQQGLEASVDVSKQMLDSLKQSSLL